MDKNEVLSKYKKEEDKLIVSKLFDKLASVQKQNKVQNTDFLSPIELNIVKKVLNMIDFENYVIYGGTENSQRNIVILYPEKLKDIFEKNKFDFNSVCNTIRVKKTEEIEHKVYLGGIIKLGVRREKVGDIIIHDDGADVIVLKEISNFLKLHLQELNRFKNASIEVIDICDTIKKEQEFKEIKIIVSSLRLDNIVSELAKTSRNKSSEILANERVFVNYENEKKNTKLVNEKDIITIRGIGKFIINEVVGNTKSGRFVILVNKYV